MKNLINELFDPHIDLTKQTFEQIKIEWGKSSVTLKNWLKTCYSDILNNKDYKVVKSTEKAFNEHYPNSWCIFGEHFVNGNLSSISKQLHEATTIAFEKLDQEKVEETFETIFKSLPNDYKEGINFNLNDLKDFYKNMRSVDSEVKDYLDKKIGIEA